ncbi:Yae1 domain-containing protein 1 [Orchesella cincta]|uniref:Yae1 domain-containing protein 1 n=1 Tax=Orchesella cincta TaxID=48709 RepID=A0A1D2NKG9_ORCCI|nr:Yae1 domain-containing protein 1 [Orchesella cincta]
MIQCNMESGDEDDAFTMGEREWQKMNRDLSKQGYRDGKTEGREKGMQESFGKAITLALNHSLQLGQLHGFLEWKFSHTEGKGQKDRIKLLMTRMGSHLEDLEDWSAESKSGDLKTEMEEKLKELANEYLQLYPKESAEVSSILGQNLERP